MLNDLEAVFYTDDINIKLYKFDNKTLIQTVKIVGDESFLTLGEVNMPPQELINKIVYLIERGDV